MQHRHSLAKIRGFSLLEMMISLALGMIVVGAAVQIFSKGLGATFAVQQKSEMQQDVRGAESMLVKDISMAGAGLPAGGIALVSGSGINRPVYGCDSTTGCVYVNKGSVNFPQQTSGSNTTNYLYAIIPGYALGPTITTGQGATDVISLTSTDPNLPLSNYAVTFTGTAISSAKFTGSVPTGSPKLNDAGYGLKVGDLLLLSGTRSGNSVYAVGEVTGVSGTASPFTVSFANTDPMKLNQSGGNNGLSSLVSPSAATSITATRLLMVTYSLDSVTDAAGNKTYRLMRQVNGQTPVPQVEGLSDLRFRYDVYDTSRTPATQTQTTDAFLSTGGSPNLIRQVDVTHLTIRSAVKGTSGYQGLDIQTSVSARNLGFSDRYGGSYSYSH